MEKIMLCSKDDLQGVQRFIHEKWRENHILSFNNGLIDFQHGNDGGYNFVIAKNQYNDITAILGFIPLSQYDAGLGDTANIWLAIWKVDEANAAPGTGFALLKWLEKHFKPNSIGSIGINKNVKRIYDILGYRAGVLKHYYITNPSVSDFKIIEPGDAGRTSVGRQSPLSVVREIERKDLEQLTFDASPQKSINFIHNRYLSHPVYKYILLGIYTDTALKAVIVARKIVVKSAACLRIVDIQGSYAEIGNLRNGIAELLNKHKCEYIDCLNHGIAEETFSKWGFSLKAGSTIIPEYFEPFVKKNIDIMFAYKSKEEKYIIFKGDSDQDRPNVILK